MIVTPEPYELARAIALGAFLQRTEAGTLIGDASPVTVVANAQNAIAEYEAQVRSTKPELARWLARLVSELQGYVNWSQTEPTANVAMFAAAHRVEWPNDETDVEITADVLNW